MAEIEIEKKEVYMALDRGGDNWSLRQFYTSSLQMMMNQMK